MIMPKDLFAQQAGGKDLFEEAGIKLEPQVQPVKETPWQEAQRQIGFFQDRPVDPTQKLIGEIGLGLIAPEAEIPAALSSILGRYGTRIAAEAVPQIGISGLLQPEAPAEAGLEAGATVAPFAAASEAIISQSPVIRWLGRITRGGLGTLLGAKTGEEIAGAPGGVLGGALGAALGARATKRGAEREIARETIEAQRLSPEYQDLLKRAREEGLPFLTPGEATGYVPLAQLQGELSRGEASSKLYKKGVERVGKEEQAILNLFDKIANEKTIAAKEKAYNAISGSKVPKNVLQMYKDDIVISQAIKDIQKEPVYQKEFAKIGSEDNIEFADLIKRRLDELIGKEENPRTGRLSNTGRLLSQTRDSLVSALDKEIPGYNAARELAQRDIVRRNLESLFNRKELTAKSLDQVLKNKKQYNDFYKSLSSVPEAQRSLENLKKLGEVVIPPVTPRTAAGFGITGMTKPRSDIEGLKTQLMEPLVKFIRGEADSEKIAEFLTDPHWQKRARQILEVTELEKKGAKAVSLLGKGLAQPAVEYLEEKE